MERILVHKVHKLPLDVAQTCESGATSHWHIQNHFWILRKTIRYITALIQGTKRNNKSISQLLVNIKKRYSALTEVDTNSIIHAKMRLGKWKMTSQSVQFLQHTLVLRVAARVARFRTLCQVRCSLANPCWNISFWSSLQGHPWPRCQTCKRCHPNCDWQMKPQGKINSTKSLPKWDYSSKKQLACPKQWLRQRNRPTMA
jgi:hypothetical protein